MTVLEEYKLKVLDLRARLNSVSSGDCTDEVLELIPEYKSSAYKYRATY